MQASEFSTHKRIRLFRKRSRAAFATLYINIAKPKLRGVAYVTEANMAISKQIYVGRSVGRSDVTDATEPQTDVCIGPVAWNSNEPSSPQL